MQQYQSPKNLAMALTVEVGELVEIFQWLTEEQSREATKDPSTLQHINDEIADVMLYLIQLSMSLGVDVNKAVVSKIEKNRKKYPSKNANLAQ